MPLGNGDIALNVWAEPDGAVLFYVAKSDALDECGRPVKLGRLRLTFSPNPWAPGASFSQVLRLRTGSIEIRLGEGADALNLLIWVDANAQVVHVEGVSGVARECSISLELLRREGRSIDEFFADSFERDQLPVERADHVVEGQHNRIVWYHRNAESLYPRTLELQGLEGVAKAQSDPLLNRTFGASVEGEGLFSANAHTLRSAAPSRQFHIKLVALSAQTPSVENWLGRLKEVESKVAAMETAPARAHHEGWWQAFWERSWIDLKAPNDGIARGYALQRFMNACAGRGALPIKFNGSLFTVGGTGVPLHPSSMQPRSQPEPYSADSRRWGSCYWFQNTRLIYWPMLASGDYDLLQPFFAMYESALPLAESRTSLYYGHGGAFFPETMHFWGAMRNGDYGWERQGRAPGEIESRYIRYYWQGGLELCAMLLDYHAYTGDDEFARRTMIPLCRAVIEFYDRHWRRDERGKLLLAPAQALETIWDAVNPAPDIAGLQAVLVRLVGLPETLVAKAERDGWSRLWAELPELPRRHIEGCGEVLAPAEGVLPEGRELNKENAELYAVFPYNLVGMAGREPLELACNTFLHRTKKGRGCWYQDAIHAACLGFTAEAAAEVTALFAERDPRSRFPAFWAPHWDWNPDMDHGGAAMIALQRMLLQSDGNRIVLLPAWPAGWDVDFKLHAPGGTTIQASVRAGKVVELVVTPEARRGDVSIARGNGIS